MAVTTAVKGWFDTLSNFMTGMMLANDKNRYNTYVRNIMTIDQLEAAFANDWIARKIVTIPAMDMTRQWREWQAENDQIEKLEACETKHLVQMKVRDALLKARLYGGAGIVIGTRENDPAKELNPERIGEGGLQYLHVVTRHDLSGLDGTETDISSPWFGLPRFYQVRTSGQNNNLQQSVRVHPSRVVRFCGNMAPSIANTDEGWGDSVLQVVNDAVQAAAVTSQSIATLIHEAKVDFIKVPRLSEIMQTKEHSDKFTERLAFFNAAKSTTNAVVMDAEEEWERTQLTFSGMPEVLEAFLLIVSGAADIPATRLHGRSPQGMNATGDSDLRNYYDRIKSDQEMYLTPAMAVLDQVLQVDALGSIDEEIFYEWSSLWQMDEIAKAGMIKTITEAAMNLVNAGLVQTSALAQGVQNRAIEEGWFPGLEAAIQDAEAEDDFVEETIPEQKLGIEGKKAGAAVTSANASMTTAKKPTPKPVIAPGGVGQPGAQKALPAPKPKASDSEPYKVGDVIVLNGVKFTVTEVADAEVQKKKKRRRGRRKRQQTESEEGNGGGGEGGGTT